MRGGSWINNENRLRCAARNRNNPNNRNNNIGFRVVRSQSYLYALILMPVALRRAGLLVRYDMRPFAGGDASDRRR